MKKLLNCMALAVLMCPMLYANDANENEAENVTEHRGHDELACGKRPKKSYSTSESEDEELACGKRPKKSYSVSESDEGETVLAHEGEHDHDHEDDLIA